MKPFKRAKRKKTGKWIAHVNNMRYGDCVTGLTERESTNLRHALIASRFSTARRKAEDGTFTVWKVGDLIAKDAPTVSKTETVREDVPEIYFGNMDEQNKEVTDAQHIGRKTR